MLIKKPSERFLSFIVIFFSFFATRYIIRNFKRTCLVMYIKKKCEKKVYIIYFIISIYNFITYSTLILHKIILIFLIFYKIILEKHECARIFLLTVYIKNEF